MREIYDLKELERVFKVLGAKVRLEILETLMNGREMTVAEISEKMRMSYKTVSRNLLMLQAAGFVESRSKGLFVCYRIKKRRTHPYNLSLLAVVRHAAQRVTLGEQALKVVKVSLFESQMKAYLKMLSKGSL